MLKDPQTLRGSFSAVSMPTFANTDSFKFAEKFSRSTSFAHYRTADISKCEDGFVENVCNCLQDFSQMPAMFLSNSLFFAPILLKHFHNFTKAVRLDGEHQNLLQFAEFCRCPGISPPH